MAQSSSVPVTFLTCLNLVYICSRGALLDPEAPPQNLEGLLAAGGLRPAGNPGAAEHQRCPKTG